MAGVRRSIYARLIAGALAAAQVASLGPAFVYADGGAGVAVSVGVVVEESRVKISAEEGGKVDAEGAEIIVPARALKRDTEIIIQRLAAARATGEGLSNVTAGDGIVGKGFGIQARGSVTTDTRWGVPEYKEGAKAEESNKHILDGSVLEEVRCEGAVTYYRMKRESALNEIKRVVEKGKDYWKVTDLMGLTRVYGRRGKGEKYDES